MIGIEHIEHDKSGNNSENRLVQAVRDFVFGKTEEFEYIYNHTAPALMTLCRRYASNEDEAKDILQESYIKIYKNLNRFDINAPFEGWAKRIAINTAIDHYRRNIKRSFNSIGTMDIAEAEDVYVSNDIMNYDIEKVMIAIQELPDGCRIILNLYVLENKSHKEIGELLGINESTSRSQLTKARKALKERFENESKQAITY